MPPTASLPHGHGRWPIPILNIHVEDIAHPGAVLFFANIQDPCIALTNCAVAVFQWLYTPESAPTNVKSIDVVLKSMSGVAHTFGDDSQKNIHFSLGYIENCASRARHEILGVLTHEMVHCFQYNGLGKCPGGLIEGIADYVRLRADLAPPHWRPRDHKGKWDSGYEKTGFFLDWIERSYKAGTIKDLNHAMKDKSYTPRIFEIITGVDVKVLWEMYCKDID